MTAYVVLLRGINVGGRTKLAMADLRTVVTAAGFDDVATYIQSGNLVCTAPGRRSSDAVADDLENAIAAAFELAPPVMVRTAAEWSALVDANPFIARGEDPSVQHVAVFRVGERPAPGGDLSRFAPEEVHAIGPNVYLHLPNGVGRSKLAAELTRQKGPSGTMRNWRTVTKLQEMVQAL